MSFSRSLPPNAVLHYKFHKNSVHFVAPFNFAANENSGVHFLDVAGSAGGCGAI